jgi:hypothetical protein
MLLVCLFTAAFIGAAHAQMFDYRTAVFADSSEDRTSPAQSGAIQKVKPIKPVVKCRPEPPRPMWGGVMPSILTDCMLPAPRARGWEIDAQVMFARINGKGRYYRNNWSYNWNYSQNPDVDMSNHLGLPEHKPIGTFSAGFRFQPQWSVKYSFTPMSIDGSSNAQNYNYNYFVWGANQYNGGASVQTKWERQYHRIALAYDPVRTFTSRVSVFGGYARMDDKISVYQAGCCGDTLNTESNMGMAGIELERCLKTTASLATLSMDCKAAVMFGDDSIGADLSTALKFSIPVGPGRWGYVSGGYRYLALNKKYSEAKLLDTALDGGFVQIGLVF